MQINRHELVRKLEFIRPAIGSNSFVLDHQYFHFNGKTLFAADGQVTILTESPIPDTSFSIKAESFLNLLRNLNTDDVKLEIKDSSLRVKTKRVEGKFQIGIVRDISLTVPKDSKSIDFCSNLLEGLRLCNFGVCKEKTSGSISGVRIEGSQAYSTDRLRIHRYDLGISPNLDSCTIPSKFIDIISKKADEITQYGLFENKFYVVLKDGSMIETSTYSEEYPNLEKYYEMMDLEKFQKIIFKSDLEEILERHLKSFLGEFDFYDKETQFDIDGCICILSSVGKNSGDLVEDISLENEVGKCSFIVNPLLVQEVLRYGKGKFLYSSENKIIFLDAGPLQILIQTKV